jgi:hypothetical protein
VSRSEHARDSEAMPTFVIEANDRLALETMAYYSELCDRHGLAERSEQAHRAYRQMAEWRVAHPISAKTLIASSHRGRT